jgi:hypothetical protein
LIPRRVDLIDHDVRPGGSREHLGVRTPEIDSSGVFPAEAIALEKPVICECDTRKLAPFARPCPVAEASAGTLAARLRELVRDPPRRRGIGATGRRYAASVHAPLSAAKAAGHVYRHAPRRERGGFEAIAAGMGPIDLSVELPALAESPGRRRSVPVPQ